MPEFEIALTFKGWYDDASDALEHGDLVAQTAERRHPDVVLDVVLKELNP